VVENVKDLVLSGVRVNGKVASLVMWARVSSVMLSPAISASLLICPQKSLLSKTVFTLSYTDLL